MVIDECGCGDDGFLEAIDNLIAVITMRSSSTTEPHARQYLKAAATVAISARETLQSGHLAEAHERFDQAFGLLHSIGGPEATKKRLAVENLLQRINVKTTAVAR